MKHPAAHREQDSNFEPTRQKFDLGAKGSGLPKMIRQARKFYCSN